MLHLKRNNSDLAERFITNLNNELYIFPGLTNLCGLFLIMLRKEQIKQNGIIHFMVLFAGLI